MKSIERQTCRVCDEPLVDAWHLGNLPISNFPLPSDPTPAKHPLTLTFSERSQLLQLKHSVDPDEMYRQYWYLSGINDSMKVALQSIVEEALRRLRLPLGEGDIVVDIASNDGTLLSFYPKHLYRIGIDPAINIHPQSCDLHINTYFSANAYASHMGNKKAKIVTSIAMFYDLEDPVRFANDVRDILDPNGLWIIELSYLPTMLEQNSFDTICAEHLEYYSLSSLEYILGLAQMAVEDIEFNQVNGGSFRLYIRHKGTEQETEALALARQKENSYQLSQLSTYIAFADRVEKNKEEMMHFLRAQKKANKKVLGYGASTKGNTILAYYGIGPDLLSFVADRNPMKWGRQTVTRIPIISEQEARELKPDFFLALPYHFIGEFLDREKEFLQGGGKFVTPIPCLRVIPK